MLFVGRVAGVCGHRESCGRARDTGESLGPARRPAIE